MIPVNQILQSSGIALSSGNAEVLTSLDYITNNRNNRPQNRRRNCGRFSLRGIDLRNGAAETRYHRVNCNCWDCSYCGPRKQKLYRRAIGAWAENLELTRFVTLTLDPKKFLPGISYADFRELHNDDPEKQRLKKLAAQHLRQSFNKLRVYLGRKYGKSIRFICVLELHESGMPHLHLLVDRYIPLEWLRSSWQKVGGGHQVAIRKVHVRNAAAYISKYLSKQLQMQVPARTRRITTSRSIRLLAVPQCPKYIEWKMLKQNIWDLSESAEMSTNRLLSVEFDPEGFLDIFAVEAHSPPQFPSSG